MRVDNLKFWFTDIGMPVLLRRKRPAHRLAFGLGQVSYSIYFWGIQCS